MTRDELGAWVEGYERAWRTPGTELLAELFARNATYQTRPFDEPYRGLEAIEELWEREREGPDEAFSLDWEIVAVEGDTGVVRADVKYADPPRHYLDLWLVSFDADGRCVAFEEWFFSPRS